MTVPTVLQGEAWLKPGGCIILNNYFTIKLFQSTVLCPSTMWSHLASTESELWCHKNPTHSHTSTAASIIVTCSLNNIIIQNAGCSIYYPVLTNVTFALFLWKPLVQAWSHILQPPSCSLTGLVYKACWPLPLRSVSLQIRLGHLPMTSRMEREKEMNQHLNQTWI